MSIGFPKGDRYVALDTGVDVVTLNNQTSNISDTDVDVTANTSPAAKAVALKMKITPDTIGSGIKASVNVKEKGSSNAGVFLNLNKDGVNITGNMAFMLIGLDADQVFQYALDVTTGWQVDFIISVIGYVE